jgi:hypothetical protein
MLKLFPPLGNYERERRGDISDEMSDASKTEIRKLRAEFFKVSSSFPPHTPIQ